MIATTSPDRKKRVKDSLGSPGIGQQGIAPRLETLNGAVVGLLANKKPNAKALLEAIYDVLAQRFDLGGKVALNKGDASRPAPTEVLDSLASDVDVVVAANGD